MEALKLLFFASGLFVQVSVSMTSSMSDLSCFIDGECTDSFHVDTELAEDEVTYLSFFCFHYLQAVA